ncbi:MAG: DUF3793 family protein [Lachnospiraceae bacterium]|nr:DUF3793 family protein [Lachnospiraceae bacterium]
MFTTLLIEQCAPTLAGIKTGNMFSVRNGRYDLRGEIRRLNAVLVRKGLRLLPIRMQDDLTLVYLFRPDRLETDLQAPEAVEILKEKGYVCGDSELCLAQLVWHLHTDETFPHEIGLFLGYPPSDVKCFMEDPCSGVKCIGCWKAFGNENEAMDIFERYRKCTAIYRRERRQGKPLEALIVDTRRAVPAAG